MKKLGKLFVVGAIVYLIRELLSGSGPAPAPAGGATSFPGSTPVTPATTSPPRADTPDEPVSIEPVSAPDAPGAEAAPLTASAPQAPAEGGSSLSRGELYEEAKRLGIAGRSSMNKEQLAAAIDAANEAGA